MAAMASSLKFNTDFAPETGRPIPVAPDVVRVTAPNPGPFTFTGTNSFIIGADEVFVLDPGPADPSQLQALIAAIGGRRVVAILLTHTHRDHSDGVPALKAATGAPVWFGGPHQLSRARRPFERNAVGRDSDWTLRPDRTLVAGEVITASTVSLKVVPTPGHCHNHLSLGLEDTAWLLAGDHIMGWNSTLVSVPDGSMADYLESLRRVIALPYLHYLPAHGGPIEDGPTYAKALLAHRENRNAQVVAAVAAGARTLDDLRRAIYPAQPPAVQRAAKMTLAAHVDYLAERGDITMRKGLFGLRLSAKG